MRVRTLVISFTLLGALLARPCSSEECVNLGDYLHWVGNAGTLGYAHGVAVSGDFACVANQSPGGMAVVDITDPELPAAIGYVSLPDADGVAVSGTHAFVAGVQGLSVIDVADPWAPLLT